jgi:thiol-disulfide isomerase/thioredoxin
MKKQLGFALVAVLLRTSFLLADVIYLENGNVLVVEKAWEEGDEVKYQVSSGIQKLPRSDVKRIQGQKSLPADPSRSEAVNAEIIRGKPSPASVSPKVAPNPGSSTSNPRERARSSRFKNAAGYQEALRLQQSGGQPIALYFYTNWCGYCARLERNILSQPEVQEYLASILYVSINPEEGQAESALFDSFDGRGFPTFLIVRKDKPSHEIMTSGPPAAFVQACKLAAKSPS